MKRAIWWVRRDLRLADNQTLHAALESADQVLPVFILDPKLLNSPYIAEKRLAFFIDGLRALDRDLRVRGSRLFVRRGDPEQLLIELCEHFGVGSVYAEQDFSPFSKQRDGRIARDVPLIFLQSLTIRHPAATRRPSGDPYRVYTPYRRTWKSLPLPRLDDLLAAPKRIPTPEDPHPGDLPEHHTQPANATFPSGEAEAVRRLDEFTAKPHPPIRDYHKKRDYMSHQGTSRLSPYLRFGMLSARHAAAAAERALLEEENRSREGAGAWLDELIWRDFFFSILDHFPEVRTRSFQPALQAIRWQNDEAEFEAWKQGHTGFPLVDAGMRELVETGWMHNRARMVVASFLVKDLLIDWRWGEKWFMQHLIDGDPAANNGGWQWSAGTGVDAAPYFRVFNPVRQSKKFDPDGEYIRRWVPELARLPGEFLHEPCKMPRDVQESLGCRIGPDYPEPIVDHAKARERALAAFQHSRDHSTKWREEGIHHASR